MQLSLNPQSLGLCIAPKRAQGLMDGRMDGWTDVWMDGRMDGRTDGRMDGCMDRQLNRWVLILKSRVMITCAAQAAWGAPGPLQEFTIW